MEVQNTNRIDTGKGEKDASAGFPSHLIDPKKKLTPEWCMDFLKGMHTANTQMSIFRANTTKYKQWRDYAKGAQEIDQYKEMLGAGKKRNKGKRNQSWRNLDYSIMPIAPKFVRLLEGMIMKQPRIIKTKGIDNESMDAARAYENKLEEWVFNREFLVKLQGEINIDVATPVAKGDPEPMTMGEIPLYKDLYYKDQNALELKDMIDTTFEVNKLEEQGRRDYVKDLIAIGVGGTKSFIDSNGFLKIRRVIPERVVTNTCRTDSFTDIQWCGEYVEMTIADLKQLAGGQFTEDQYRKIAEAKSNKNFGVNYLPTHLEEDIISYPYDNEKITVLDGEWFSVDKRTTKMTRNKYGNKRAEKVANTFLPNGVSDDQYKESHNGEKWLIRRNLKNVYRGIWVVDTPYIFNYGLATDMIRMGSSLEDAQLSYAFYTTAYDSIIRMIIPILDQIQINWLQFQNHIARSRPSGLSIEMSALENLSLGKGKEKMSPKEALRLYFDTGILLWRRKEWSGHTSQWRPVEELRNEISTAAAQHFQNILGMIDMLRNIIGINEVSDASTPNPDIGKFVTETAMVATKEAIDYLYHADKKIYEQSAEKIALLIPDLVKRGKSKAFMGALGVRSYNFFKKNIDLSRYEFSTKIEAGYSDDQRAVVQRYLQLALQKETIHPEDAIKIENEENPHKQVQMLRQAKTEKLRGENEQAQVASEREIEKNTQSAQAAAAAEVEKMKSLSQITIQEGGAMSGFKINEQNNEIKGKIILAKIENGHTLTEQEEKIAADILQTEMKIEGTIQVAEIGAKSREKAAASKPKPPATAKKRAA